jgi:soluble lytic murein transglycosylase-like protein
VQQGSSRKLSRCLALITCLLAPISVSAEPLADFPALPLPPPVEGLVGLPKPHPIGRLTHVRLVRQEAQQRGLPPEVADAVALVESAYNPNAVGTVGEVGLMQVRPTTAAMLGHSGTVADLHEPSTNVRYGVRYLAEAWKLANGDLCRALMKYRAGHGEERFSERSVEYCRRARGHLASLGSPLANAPLPMVNFVPATPLASGPGRVRAAGRGLATKVAKAQEAIRRAKSRQLWAAHDARMKAIMSKVSSASLRIAAGI